MSEILNPPVMTLDGPDAIRAAVKSAPWQNRDRFQIKSPWMIALIEEIEATGQYPYNAVVQREAEKRLGIAEQPDNGSTLSVLVYNAQRYRRSDELEAGGYVKVTDAMVKEAHAKGLKIETPGGTLYTVREVEGKLYTFKPRHRRWASGLTGYPGKLAK